MQHYFSTDVAPSRRRGGGFSRSGIIAFSLLGLLAASSLPAQLVSIDFPADATSDGNLTGTGSMTGTSPAIVGTVAITSTDGSVNGGITFSTSWDTQSGTDGVPGIGGSGWVNEAFAVDWNAGVAGSATLTLGGPAGIQVTNPVALFNFLDAQVETFDFDDALTLTLIDQSPAGSVSIAAGNVVTTTGVLDAGGSDDTGFAVQVTGTFPTGTIFTIATNTNLGGAQSVGCTVAADEPLPVELIQYSVE